MRKRNKFQNPIRLLIFLSLLVQFHCLLNPIVREFLEFDLSKKNNQLRNLGLLFGLFTGPNANITPSLGNVILANAQIRVIFNRSMDPNSLSANLGIQLTPVWSETFSQNDTVTLSGSIPTGVTPFQLDATDTFGIRMTTVTGSYVVLNSNTNLYYVSPSGNDGNSGTSIQSPKLTISSAIAGATTPAAILVSEGDYSIDSVLGSSINLTNNVSLYGGLSSNFLDRNPSLYSTRIIDTATSATTDTITILAGASITLTTVIDGFTIRSASNPNATGFGIAISCVSGSPTITNNRVESGNLNIAWSTGILVTSASPLISNNTIISGSSSVADTFGIFIRNAGSPTVSYNTIYGGNATTSAHAIYNSPDSNSPTIIGNTLEGGSGSISYALNTSYPSNATVTNNLMNGGGGVTSIALYHGFGSGDIGNYQNNVLFTSGGTNRYCLYEGGGTNPISFNGNRLLDCPTALYFDEATTIINDIATINGGTVGGPTYSGNY
ncbi:DUF1565 domain-containing protein [Leptospira brenneri]|uniref:DUF1565 domain-containing protein n=1 Tax=Leptospira brenneri TaxID=2023182 RepID=A0A2M9Y027_9LEPT|nr:DUF1565 domain-containing protein [Leptospira brenneri]PJZ44938.1 hypothetical protein CH361_11840 [Leptospira brenneri]TGK95261.1 DUF1565 domain-containing protein [Leptospira brenneri]